MNVYRNSQKRVYLPGVPVFITANTFNRFEYFREDIFCQLLVEEMNFAREAKKYDLMAYKIIPDHIHLIIQPDGEEYNYSQIMHFIKRQTSRNANLIMDEATDLQTGKLFPYIKILRKQFIIKHGNKNPYPPFKWQKSFHSHLITTNEELNRIKKYIIHQKEKHNLKENTYLYIK